MKKRSWDKYLEASKRVRETLEIYLYERDWGGTESEAVILKGFHELNKFAEKGALAKDREEPPALIYNSGSSVTVDLNNPKLIAEGEFLIVHEFNEFEFGPVTNPTDGDMVAAGEAHIEAGDWHHVFLEGWKVDKEAGKIHLWLGS